MVEVIALDAFAAWFDRLGEADTEAVVRVVTMLELRGVGLPYPYSSAIVGTPFPIRELRVQSQGRPLRVLYAFDPRRNAVLILGGDKTGDDRFYEREVRTAEKLWKEYLDENP